MTKITESRTRDILHWLDDRLAEPDLPYQAMALLRDAAALIRQLQAAEQAAWHAGLDEGREQGRGNEHCQAEPQPVAWQFQDRDGRWHGFVDEKHRQNTIADRSWPVRALYTAPLSAPVGVEGLMQLAREWCLAWGEWAHDADPGCAKENAAEAALRAALTTALAQQPAACPKCGGTGEADSGGIMPWGAPAMIPCDCKQPAAVDGEVVRRIEGLARRWDESANNDKSDSRRAAKRKCAADLRALTAALAAQPGGDRHG